MTDHDRIEKLAEWMFEREASEIGVNQTTFNEISRMAQMRFRGKALELLSIVRQIEEMGK
jgi:hypothetical protein